MITSDTSGNLTDNFTLTCHTWLMDVLPMPLSAVSLDTLNRAMVQRNIAGIGLLSILIMFGLIGNSHVIYIYIRYFKTSNYKVYVLYLAAMDIVNSCIVAPLVIVYLFYPLQYPSSAFCKIFRFILYVMAIASTSSLVVIAIDRHRKICNPLGPQFGIRKAKLLCLASFVFSVILSVPAPILYGMSTTETGIPGLIGYRCFTEDHIKKTNYQTLFNAILGLYFIGVTTCLVIVYIKIGRHIFHHQRFQSSIRRMSARSEEEVKMATGSSARRSTWTLCVVTITYVLCALPHHLLATLIFLKPGFDCNLSLPGAQIYYMFIWSYFVNSVVNPFIYGIRDRKFRFEIKNLYRR